MDVTHPTDNAQAALWNGPAGRAWVDAQEQLDQVLKPFEDLLVEAVRAGSAHHVLDVGCGTGGTTLAVARRLGSDCHCTGVDISAPMIAAAHTRADREGRPASFICADAQTHAFAPASFDTIISRFGVMFFDDPVAAFTNLARAAKPGGRLCFVCWQAKECNPWYTFPSEALAPHIELSPAPSGPGPFTLAEADRVRQLLDEAGWAETTVDPFEPSMLEGAGGNVDRVIRHMVRGPVAAALRNATPAARAAGLDALRAAISSRTIDGEVRFPTAAWMVEATKAA
jgi:SAM-dependent methyltransferase